MEGRDSEVKRFEITEHDYICVSSDSQDDSMFEKLSKLNLKGLPDEFMGAPEHLGLNLDSYSKKLEATYFIGADWLIPNEVSVVVTPKIPNLDFMEMFSEALAVETKNEADYFARCYGISFDQPEIEVSSSVNILSPMLVVHFCSLVEKLVKAGLKRGYINREENLRLKVKGRILVSKNIRSNLIQKREDHVFCRYQEFTDDIPENRLLKKALLFSRKIIQSYNNSSNTGKILSLINKLISSFTNVSDDIEIHEIKDISVNKLFRRYTDALKVAKMILRRYDYCIDNIDRNTESRTPPFWIYMPALYELFVYSKLERAYPGQIQFQVSGHYRTKVDYIKTGSEEQVIIDAKYKPRYASSNAGILSDIREISGYARDKKILQRLKYVPKQGMEPIVPCVIIYPEKVRLIDDDNSLDSDYDMKSDLDPAKTICEQATPFDWFEGFYKLGIDLPRIGND